MIDSCAGIGDLERAVARIAATCADAVARDADAVVLYENAAKRRVQAFVAALNSLQALQVRFAVDYHSCRGWCMAMLLQSDIWLVSATTQEI